MNQAMSVGVLGDGRGIDHVGIAVRDLATAQQTYQAGLGFTVMPGGKHPGGTQNAAVWFTDDTYLELITFSNQEQAFELANFLKQHEGALFLGLDVASADQTATLLRSGGFEIGGPQGGTIALAGVPEPPPELWRIVSFTQAVVPGNAIFFIEYHRTTLNDLADKYSVFNFKPYANHANTATRLAAVWMAVENLKAATTAYGSIGLAAGRDLRVPNLGAVGREVGVGRGHILLLQAEDDQGKVAAFLRERGAGIIGISIEVRNLEAARSLLPNPVHLNVYSGPYGKSICIPPELTHGVWMELFEPSNRV